MVSANEQQFPFTSSMCVMNLVNDPLDAFLCYFIDAFNSRKCVLRKISTNRLH